MKIKGRAWLVVGLALLLAVVLATPALGGAGPAPASNVVKVTLVHYPAGKGLIKPLLKPAPKADSDTYKLLRVKWAVPANGVSFTMPESDWFAANDLDYEAVKNQMQAAFDTWDDETGAELFSNSIGTGGAVGPKYDEANTISFGPVAYAGALAVTTYWYDRRMGQFIEADIEFSTAFPWKIYDTADQAGNPNSSAAYDIRNVGTHEVGHVVGLADLYRTTQSELTMYGYASPAETIKWTLEPGDIAGVQYLYGSN